MRNIVDEGKRCHAARLDAQQRCEVGGGAKRKPWGREAGGELIEIDAVLLKHDCKPEPALFVFEKEALAMTARQSTARRRRLGDGEDRPMRNGAVGNTERVETPEQLFGCEWRGKRDRKGGHGRHDAVRRPAGQASGRRASGLKLLQSRRARVSSGRSRPQRTRPDAGVAQG